MKIVGISGSLRKGSLNTALLGAMSRMLPEDVEYEQADIDLPLYTGNEDKRALPVAVEKLRSLIDSADGLIITCPEYNWNITVALKNAIDWLSLGANQAPLNNHVVAIAGVGGGRLGSVRAQMALRTALLHNRVWVVPGPEVLIAPNDHIFDTEGNLADPVTTGFVSQLIDELLRVTPLLQNN